jgi:hypothetical protein
MSERAKFVNDYKQTFGDFYKMIQLSKCESVQHEKHMKSFEYFN